MKIQSSLLALLLACPLPDLQAKVVQLTAARFQQLSQERQGIILDVRTPAEVASGHIDGATAVSIQDPAFAAKIRLMTKDRPVYIYCLSGGRSNAAARVLLENGFDEVFNLQGGILAWRRAKLPLVTAAAAPETGPGAPSSAEVQKLISEPGLVLLDFFAPWCGPCRQMRPILGNLTAAYGHRLRVVKIDLTDNQTIADYFEVASVPSFVLIKDGTVVWKRTGAIGESEFRTAVQEHLER